VAPVLPAPIDPVDNPPPILPAIMDSELDDVMPNEPQPQMGIEMAAFQDESEDDNSDWFEQVRNNEGIRVCMRAPVC
jgi:hypothetical protein